MQNIQNTNKILDVKTAKIYTNLGYSYLSSVQACYLYRTMLTESVAKLKSIESVLADKNRCNELIALADSAMKANLDYLGESHAKFLQEFISVDQLEHQYISFCETMDSLQAGLYQSRKRIESFLSQYEAELNKIAQDLRGFEEAKIQILSLKGRLTELSEENTVLKKTISILSR